MAWPTHGQAVGLGGARPDWSRDQAGGKRRGQLEVAHDHGGEVVEFCGGWDGGDGGCEIKDGDNEIGVQGGRRRYL